MKIVVIGGTGLIGSKVVACLDEEDHEAVAASPDTGVNTLTGEGLAVVLEGASVVIDVSNSPSIEDEAVMEFFTTSTNNLLAATSEAGVRHYAALSVVGADRVTDRVACPTLVTQAEEVPAARSAAKLYDALAVEHRALIKFTSAEDAGQHREANCRRLYHQRINWLDDTLA
jgi:uncharacterized protein YbjT (DUF2867 family)